VVALLLLVALTFFGRASSAPSRSAAHSSKADYVHTSSNSRPMTLATCPASASKTTSVQSKGTPHSFLPKSSRNQVSSILYSAQSLLRDHATLTQKVRARAATLPRCAPLPAAFNAPGGALMANTEPFDLPQNEESIAVDFGNSSLAVTGYNDFQGFFLLNNTLTGYATTSYNGTSTSVVKSGWLPGVVDPYCTDGSILDALGDPSFASDQSGNIVAGTLADSIVGDCNGGDNGIIVSKSNSGVYNGGTACNDAETSNSCWTSHLIDSHTASSLLFDDKDWLAVNTNNGHVYVAWDQIDENAGTEVVQFSDCNNSLSACSAPITISDVADTNTFSPYVGIWTDGTPLVSYEQIGSSTVDFHLVHLTDSTSTPAIVSNNRYRSIPFAAMLQGLATDGYRILTQVKFGVDLSKGANRGDIYATYDKCASTSDEDQIAGFLCDQAVVRVDLLTSPTGSATQLSTPSAYDQTFPSISVDPSNGKVWVAYYTTQNDVDRSTQEVVVTSSSGGTGAFGSVAQVTTSGNSYQADTLVQLGFAPQNGDYMQLEAKSGKVYVSFNANYDQKSGLAQLTKTNQEDNYVCLFPAGTGPCK
jgi:hypothetical protein